MKQFFCKLVSMNGKADGKTLDVLEAKSMGAAADRFALECLCGDGVACVSVTSKADVLKLFEIRVVIRATCRRKTVQS